MRWRHHILVYHFKDFFNGLLAQGRKHGLFHDRLRLDGSTSLFPRAASQSKIELFLPQNPRQPADKQSLPADRVPVSSSLSILAALIMFKRTLNCLLLSVASLFILSGRADTAEPGEPSKPDAVAAEIARLKQAGFPLVDFHVHLKGGLTIEEAVALSRRNGIQYGIAANCGLKFPIQNDRDIARFVESLKGQPVFIGMQAEGREWPRLFSKEAVAKFDYVFTDAMTIVDHRGQRARLWIQEEVDIPDKQAFMELLVRTIVDILNNEPIDIYVNPTYLPNMLAAEYDHLWTPERLTKIIDAAAKNGVAIEINNGLHLPKPAFIKQAKQAGVKFTFGTNNTNHNLGRLEYCLDMIKQCGLTPQDMWMPKPDGQKPVQVKKLPQHRP